ncbi:MAG: iron ABC transporter permease [Burkholderiaceae bacterium]|nr:iron ABC transporter permease [Burkholderiaceae bacterium]
MRTVPVHLLLWFLLVIVLVVALGAGSYQLSPAELISLVGARISGAAPDVAAPAEIVFWQIRAPRVVGSTIVGAALAAAGLALQATFRNPLASPDLLGVSAGAALGAVVGMFLGWGVGSTQAAAFAGGLLTVALVYFVARRLALRDRLLGLLLSGIAIASLLGAMIALVKIAADPRGQLPAITFWLLGSFASLGAHELAWLSGACLLGLAPLVVWRWRADALALSDDEVRSIGLRPAAVRAALVIGATLATAACVAVAGIIGWVGLVVPHAARLLVGASFRSALPVSMLLGAALMTAIDTIGRVFTVVELPPGVLTALVGAPALFLLIVRVSDEHAR